MAICQSDSAFILMATPSGGEWMAAGIDPAAVLTGEYQPALVNTLADTVVYTASNGCTDSIAIELLELDAGHEDAACPGTAAFLVSGGFPEGGTWSGPYINSEGWFDPTTIGSFEVTYTHPNGCAGSKLVNVDHIVLPAIDSVCQSAIPFALAVTPFGGIWSGPGIIDSLTGIFDPSLVPPGNLSLSYHINGCADSLTLFVKEINAADDLSACPLQAPFVLPGDWGPSTGIWSGSGIIDSTLGWYDPSILGDGKNDTLQFRVNGCTDQRVVFIRTTTIGLNDTLRLCSLDDPFDLMADQLGIVPPGGRWIGPGIDAPANG
ncbi:MAG: hypothetical protein AAGD05_12215, partial [Bacteroidota bacterium]